MSIRPRPARYLCHLTPLRRQIKTYRIDDELPRDFRAIRHFSTPGVNGRAASSREQVDDSEVAAKAAEEEFEATSGRQVTRIAGTRPAAVRAQWSTWFTFDTS